MVNTLYLAAAGTASIDSRDEGWITSIALISNNAAAGAAEVSFNSVSSLTTNDTTGVVAGLINAAGSNGTVVVVPMREPISVGERIFLHGTGANTVRAFISIEATSAAPRPAVRRR